MWFLICCAFFISAKTLAWAEDEIPEIPKFDEIKPTAKAISKATTEAKEPESFPDVQPDHLNKLPSLWGAGIAIRAPLQGNWRATGSAIVNLQGGYVQSTDSQITYLKIANLSLEGGYASPINNNFQPLQLHFLAYEQRKLGGINFAKTGSFLRIWSDFPQNVTVVDWVTQSLSWIWHYPEGPNPYLGKSYFLVQAGLGVSSLWDLGKGNAYVRVPLLAELRLRLSSYPYDTAFWVEASRSYYGLLQFYEDNVRAQIQIAKSIPEQRWTVGVWVGVHHQRLYAFPDLPKQLLQQLYVQAGLRLWW